MMITQENVESIDELNGLVHDLWLSLETIQHDEKSRTLTIPLSEANQAYPNVLLRFYNVEALQYKDTEQVGSYDIYELRYNATKHEIVIECNIPLDIRVSLANEFSVEVVKLSDRT